MIVRKAKTGKKTAKRPEHVPMSHHLSAVLEGLIAIGIYEAARLAYEVSHGIWI